MALTRDQRIDLFKSFGKSQAAAEARADADIARENARATKVAADKAARDFALSLCRKPGTAAGHPVWNDTLKRWERA